MLNRNLPEENELIVREAIEVRKALRSLFKDHCFNVDLPLRLRLELYSHCEDEVPLLADEIKTWTTRTKKFIVRLNARVRRLKVLARRRPQGNTAG